MKLGSLYDVLGVTTQASELEIRQAYIAMAKRFHPDATRHDPSSELKFKKAKEAYEALRDPKRRAIHDREIGARRSFGAGQLSAERDEILSSFGRTGSSLRERFAIKNSASVALKAIRWTFSAISRAASSTVKQLVALLSTFRTNEKLSIYDIESLPVSLGEAVRIRPPLLSGQLESFMKSLMNSFNGSSALVKASVVQLSFPDSKRPSVFLIGLKVPSSVNLTLPVVPRFGKGRGFESLGEVFILKTGTDVFSEALWNVGTEFPQ